MAPFKAQNMALNSFVVSQDTLVNFNQVKGKYMTAFFRDSEVSKVDVQGNGESIYFALTEEMDHIRGMNKAACSNMVINFKNNEVDDIVFYVNPDAEFIPPHELTSDKRLLKGFQWLPERRPSRDQVLHGDLFFIEIPFYITYQKHRIRHYENHESLEIVLDI